MSRTSLRTRALGLAAVATLGLTVSLGGAAQAAPAKGGVYAPNGMVGVSEQVAVFAPNLKGQAVTIGFQNGSIGLQQQTSISASGWGSMQWTPSAAGSWTISGLGNAISVGSTTIAVGAAPTSTIIVAPNNVQQGVQTQLVVFVTAQGGTSAPQGTVTLSSTFGSPVGTATLQPYAGFGSSNISSATINWVPTAALAPYAMQAVYTPTGNNWAGSTSPVSSPNIQAGNPIVSLRFAPVLRVNQPTYLSVILGQGYGDGTVAFIVGNTTVPPGSVQTVNGTALVPWTPTTSGNTTIVAQYTAKNGLSGSSTQPVNIQAGLPVDNITVDPPTQPVWAQGLPIQMTAGQTVTLAGTAVSGAQVLFSEQGPCVINGTVLTTLSAGVCTVSASTVGSPGAYQPVTENYVVSVKAAPKKR